MRRDPERPASQAEESPTPVSEIASGRTLFVENCSTCHGIDVDGSARAPNPSVSAAATIDLWLSSGWMPLSDPDGRARAQALRCSTVPRSSQIVEVRGLPWGPTAPGNPGIPFGLDISHANVAEGFNLFALNCAPCHTITGAGDALANGIQAPPLHGVTKTNGLGGDPDRPRQHAPLRTRDAVTPRRSSTSSAMW